MSDLVINVKQIGSYPPLNPVTGSEVLICQSGGLGGPYYSVTMQNMIVNTLSNFGGPVGIGVGSLPTDAAGDTLFSGDIVALPGVLGYAFNAYRYNTSGSKYWQTGPAGMFEMDASTGTLNWFSAPSQPAGLVIDAPGVTPGGPGSLWFNTMNLTPTGALSVPDQITTGQQVTVGRAPNAAMEVVNYGMFNSVVQSMVMTWNGRFGAVTMTLLDITNAGGAPNQSPALTGVPTAPNPTLGTNTNQIATTAWVLNQITSVTAGVVSWNGRSGVVTMTPADITNAGGITQTTANASFLALAGGTMTGPITMSAGANQNMEVPVLGQVGARVGASTPPATPAPLSGNLWWDSNGAQLYAWTGQQWVIAVNPPIPDTSSFLRLSGGTMTGPLQMTSVLTISPPGYEVINQNSVAPPSIPAGFSQPALWIAAAPATGGTSSIVELIDCWGPVNPGIIQFRVQGGTPAAPAAIGNQNIGGIQWGAFDGTNFGMQNASFIAWTGATWSPTSHPAAISVYSTPPNSTTPVNVWQFRADIGNTTPVPLTMAANPASTPVVLQVQNTGNGGVILNVESPGATDCKIQLNQGTGAAPQSQWQISAQGYTSPGQFYIYNGGLGWTGIQIDTAGNCYNMHGTWGIVSDPHLKTNVEDYTSGLDAIRQLQPITYHYNGKGETPDDTKTGTRRIGLDASVVKGICPEVCSTTTRPFDTEAARRYEKDPHNEPKPDEIEIDTLFPGHLIFTLINAVKELAAKVEALEGAR